VLYEMLSGDPPFTGNTPQAMIVAHLSTPPPPLASRRPGIPPALAAVVHKALEKQPSARYASAGEFRDALDRLRTSVAPRRWWSTAALMVAVAALFWWSPWRKRPGEVGPGTDIVVLTSGFRDRSGSLRAEGAALDDAMRLELQKVPGLKVIDIADHPDAALDSLRQLYRVDLIIRGAVDRIGDSASATVRLIDATNGREVRSAVLRRRSPASLQAAATALGPSSLFGAVRFALDSVLLERWMLGLGTDSATADLRQRARIIRLRDNDAMTTAGPRRMIEELQLADSMLAAAMLLSPTSALPRFERAMLAKDAGFKLVVARQVFPDSTWLPAPSDPLLKGIPFASAVIARAPSSGDAWFARSRLYSMLFLVTQELAWRDSALRDLKKASAISGGRADIWVRRASIEAEAGLFRDALFSVQQGEATDHLQTNAAELRFDRAVAELGLQQFDNAMKTCRSGAKDFPDESYFVTCDAEVMARRSREAGDARRILALADSLEGHMGRLPAITIDELRLYAVAILARGGRTDGAEQAYRSVVSGWTGAVDPTLLLDAVYARQVLGDRDSALALAARAVRQDPAVASSLTRLPWYQPLRDHPLFAAAMDGIAPAEARRR
jgi:hypothetical protein